MLTPLVLEAPSTILQESISLVFVAFCTLFGLCLVPRRISFRTFCVLTQPLLAGYFICFITLSCIFGVGFWALLKWAVVVAKSPTAVEISYMIVPTMLSMCSILALWILESSFALVDSHLIALAGQHSQSGLNGIGLLMVPEERCTLDSENKGRESVATAATRIATADELWTPQQQAHVCAFVTAGFAGIDMMLRLASMSQSLQAYLLNVFMTVVLEVLARTNLGLKLMEKVGLIPPFVKYLKKSNIRPILIISLDVYRPYHAENHITYVQCLLRLPGYGSD
ncbi:uncharacterized protein BJ171DRAFT_620952 [Polychytrium aggregatum]|uniref:uncharacterized protein n=1 Tax=Polychytrium aggregatum TaxID=110093 RepID=UPI0022FE24EF|nr:uncharacterized protein BJ171DRAFT_620952 [Polychytrium aggregatum]KAI9209487.1 hypothetical protein BJ171DRAFT_620952 [Polychytrium aggregatum]